MVKTRCISPTNRFVRLYGTCIKSTITSTFPNKIEFDLM